MYRTMLEAEQNGIDVLIIHYIHCNSGVLLLTLYSEVSYVTYNIGYRMKDLIFSQTLSWEDSITFILIVACFAKA